MIKRLLLTVLVIILGITPSFGSFVDAQEVVPNNVNVLYLSYNPVDPVTGKDAATQFFGWIYGGMTLEQTESKLKEQTIDTMRFASRGKYNISVVENLSVTTFHRNTDGFLYNFETYSECVTDPTELDTSMCEARKIDFDYENFFRSINICSLIEQKNITEIWMMSLPFVMGFESMFIVNNEETGFPINGPAIYLPECTRSVPVVNGTFDRFDSFIHSYAHRVEWTLMRMASTWSTKDRNRHVLRFLKMDKFITLAPGEVTCGNTHIPHNTKKHYKYDSKTMAASWCKDWRNFPDYQDSNSVFDCKKWGCNELGWQKFWMSNIPFKSGTTDQIRDYNGKKIRVDKNWWKVIFYPETLMVPSP